MEVKLTRGGVCYELEYTPFTSKVIYQDKVLTFHFSSQYNLDKFEEKVEENRDKINYSLSNRFNMFIELNELCDIKLYETIEKRGFLIVNSDDRYLCLNTIKLSGVNLTQKS